MGCAEKAGPVFAIRVSEAVQDFFLGLPPGTKQRVDDIFLFLCQRFVRDVYGPGQECPGIA
jgi:hypothetical protein